MSLFCLFVVLCSVMTLTNIIANINSIPMLNSSNFKSCQENLLMDLALMNFDIALRAYSPPPLMDESTSDDKKEIEMRNRSNHMCIMIMKKANPKAFRGSMFRRKLRLKNSLWTLKRDLSRMKR